MNRRNFIGYAGFAGGMAACLPSLAFLHAGTGHAGVGTGTSPARELQADVVVAGGGMGSCAAALAALRNGLRVIMTEETDWIGGQVTQQGVPLDEHQWIETHGCTAMYREFRQAIRRYYLSNYPLTEEARSRRYLNPGDGNVSRLCCDPLVALTVLQGLLLPYASAGKLTLLTEYKVTDADVSGDRIRALKAIHVPTAREVILSAPYFVDGTELGDLLPITGTEYRTGAESRAETGELHAPDTADPLTQQAFTVCFAIDHEHGADHTIERPDVYDFWKNYTPDLQPSWSGRLFELLYSNPRTLVPRKLAFQPDGADTGDGYNIWNYRRIVNKANFKPGFYASDVTIVNWPQNDYLLGSLIDVDAEIFHDRVEKAKGLNRSLLYWLQTEAPRMDGGRGWPGLRLRGDVLGTEDGMAKYPYIREARRIKPVFTVLEEHVGEQNRKLVAGSSAGGKAAEFADSVGVGYFRIDLHPTITGTNYIDIAALPFQIPLGSLLPQRMKNLVAANKNIGTTHITNGCYRLHHVEWNIGESAGLLLAFVIRKGTAPHAVRENGKLLADFQQFIRSQGVETNWKAL